MDESVEHARKAGKSTHTPNLTLSNYIDFDYQASRLLVARIMILVARHAASKAASDQRLGKLSHLQYLGDYGTPRVFMLPKRHFKLLE